MFVAVALLIGSPIQALAVTTASITDASECSAPTGCGPDITSATAVYDPIAGYVGIGIHFSAPLPISLSDSVEPASEVKIVLGSTVAGGHCGNIADGPYASGLAAGDLIMRGPAVRAPYGTQWSGVNLIVGGVEPSGSLESVNADGLATSIGAESEILVGRTFRCFEVSVNAYGGDEAVQDATPYTWFTGMGPAPSVTSVTAAGVAPTQAVVAGSFDPEGSALLAYVEYGTTTAYGLRSEDSTQLFDASPLSFPLSRLLPASTYHFRVVATSAAGTTTTPDATFTTLAGAPARPVDRRLPSLAGSLRVGSIARCSRGTWSPSTGATVYRWYRSGAVVAGQHASTYRIRKVDRGRSLRCSVSVGGSASARSPGRSVAA
jgi:hypothetical protein